MINREMKPYTWSTNTTAINEYGEQTSSLSPLRTIQAAIYFDRQNLTKNPLYLEATHIGLTKEKGIQIHDTIGSFVVLQTNPIGRFNQLILKQV